MMDPYPEAREAARLLMREGEPIGNVHRAAADIFSKHGFAIGHLSGHSIGLTMLEHPAIGAKGNVVMRENMVFSFHPQVIDQNGTMCLYTQDTYRVGVTSSSYSPVSFSRPCGNTFCDQPSYSGVYY